MMINMSYVRFENTLKALEEAKGDMDKDTKELSASERYARKCLIELCREIAGEYYEAEYEKEYEAYDEDE